MNPRRFTPGVIDDPVLDLLVGGICYACAEFLKIERGIFALAMTVSATGKMGIFHASGMDVLDGTQRQMAIEAELASGLADGRFQAVANCVNIAYQDTYEAGALPVLAIRVMHRTTAQPLHLRVPYKREPDGTVRFGWGRVVAGADLSN